MDGQVPTVKHRELYSVSYDKSSWKKYIWDIPGSSVFKTPHFNLRGCTFNHWSGTNPTGHTLNKRMLKKKECTHIYNVYIQIYMYI